MAGIISGLGLTTGLGLGPSGLTGATASTAASAAAGRSLSIIGATGIVTLDNSDPLARQRIIVIRTAAAAATPEERRDLWSNDEEQQARDRNAVLGEDNQRVNLNTLLLQHELNGMSISDIRATGTKIVGQVINTDRQTVGLVVRTGNTNSYVSTKQQTLDSTLPIMGIINKTQKKTITTVRTTEEPWYMRLL